MVGRGSACADIDSDGDLDVVLTAVGGKPRLLRNDQQTGNHWVQFLLRGRCLSTAMQSVAWVEIYCGEDVFRRQVMPTRSYLSQSAKTVCFGRRAFTTNIDKVAHLLGRSGETQELLAAVPVGQLHHVWSRKQRRDP